MPTIESRMTEIAGEIKRETEMAIQFFDGKTTCWLPKRLVTDNGDGTFDMPEWIAKEKGLI